MAEGHLEDRLSGNAGYLKIDNLGGESGIIPFTQLTPKITRKLGDTTDSADYDNNNFILTKTQIPIQVYIEATVQGRYRYSSTPDILGTLYSDTTKVEVIIGLDFNRDTAIASFFADLSDFTVEIPVDDIVTWSATIMSYGFLSINSNQLPSSTPI